MRRDRDISQKKEQNKTSEKELNKIETRNLPDAKFKALVTLMLNDVSENFNREMGNTKIKIENIKKNQSEINSTLTEMKNTLQGINTADEAEDQTSS